MLTGSGFFLRDLALYPHGAPIDSLELSSGDMKDHVSDHMEISQMSETSAPNSLSRPSWGVKRSRDVGRELSFSGQEKTGL